MRALAPDSPRRLAAARFAAELNRVMASRKVSAKRLAAAIGSATSAVAVWRAGDNLPRTDTAQRLADALDAPRLVELARAGRQGTCARCGRAFVNEGGQPKRFCTSECREVDEQLRAKGPVGLLYAAVKAEVDRVHGTTGTVSRKVLAGALSEYRRSEAKRQSRSRTLETRLGVLQGSIDAMCAGCEPSGVCRDAVCPLRAVSPFPLALAPGKHAAEVRQPEGAWGPNHRPGMLVAIRAANAERWSRDGERERQGEATRLRFAALSDDERAERGRRISAGRRRSA